MNYNDDRYTLATVFSLAYPYGTPTILSGYEFSDNDAGAPNDGAGSCDGTGGSDGWLCQHRWVAVSGMVAFRNEVGDAELTDWQSPNDNQIAFGRGESRTIGIIDGKLYPNYVHLNRLCRLCGYQQRW